MTPRQFEEVVCEHFRNKGYEAKTNSYVGDYGVDVFATKGKEKGAIQVKMYGGGTRKINRQMIMELHCAKDYFDCSNAVIATDGTILKDAKEVANKLKIDILYIDSGIYNTLERENISQR
jgi:restriction system protein